MSSYFTLLHSRSTNTLSNARPRPSMLTATPADSSRPVNAAAVNCTPWSVLKISGLPPLKASSSISVQNGPSSVFDRRQVHEPRGHRHVRDVGAPDLIPPPDRHAPEQVRVDPVPLPGQAQPGLG